MVFRPFALTIALIGAIGLSRADPSARELSIEDRIKAQESIERVYHSHQLGDDRRFEDAVPRRVLERKVRDYLKKSVALDRIWNTSVTADMLRNETERMARRTMMPERLRELYAALGDDPFLIQECLARPALVDRLARSFFDSDRIIHATARRGAEELREELVQGRIDPSVPHPSSVLLEIVREAAAEAEEGGNRGEMAGIPIRRSHRSRIEVPDDDFKRWDLGMPAHVGSIGPVREERERFVVHVTLERHLDALRVAVFSTEKQTWDRWWKDVGHRFDERAVLTVATEESVSAPRGRTGERWDPVSGAPSGSSCTIDDTWENGSLDDMPQGRWGHTAVWTGSLMIVWGGTRGQNSVLSFGARYDPGTDTWTRVSAVNQPSPRSGHTAVWTGSRMVVWGGADQFVGLVNTGGLYDPVSDSWAPTSLQNAPAARWAHTAVWTASRMVVWGGQSVGELNYFLVNTGGRYDPAADSWEPTSLLEVPSARLGHTAIWTGSVMVVWGGGSLDTGGRYDPANDTWSPTSTAGAPAGRSGHTSVWTGSVMVVWGGGANFDTGARYDPVTDLWSATSTVNAPTGRFAHVAIWLPDQSLMMVWGGAESIPFSDPVYLDTGGLYDAAANIWLPLPSLNAPSARSGHTVVWTGREAVVWGGSGGVDGYTDLNSGGRYDPSSSAWAPTAVAHTPVDRLQHTAIWTGSVMIIWGGYDQDQDPSFTLASGGRYDPALDTWTPTSMAGAPSPRSLHTAIWTGSQMIVWGGLGHAVFDSGGRYDPLSDTWSPTSIIGAPSHRWWHTAIWTGSRMVVWGGNDGSTVLASGGRYNPANDTWSQTSMINAPVPRFRHAAVWTESLMLVFGGDDGGPSLFNTGGRYDPMGDTWSAISTVDAPAARYLHTAVWTGTRMVVWGGYGGPGPALNTGGRYDPVADAWAPTSLVNAPSGRYAHTAVWTGRLMVVWSGTSGSSNTGGRYEPQTDTWTGTSRVGAPSPRTQHTAIWTGIFMIVWGGGSGNNDGGRYCVVCTLNTYYRDGDGDGFGDSGSPVEGCSRPAGYVATSGDCNDADGSIWGSPGETGDLLFVDNMTLVWTQPADPGATSVVYDVLRSGIGSNFTSAATCVDSDIPSTTSVDGSGPGSGAGFYYLVRAQNTCVNGQGPLGRDSNGVSQPGRDCP